MLSAYKYRLYPKRGQEMRLKRSLPLLCSLYNWLRATKIERYRQNGTSLTKTDLRKMALEYRKNNPELQAIHSQVVQNVADRVAEAFRNYFEGRARFPKKKNPRKYLSLTYPQSGFQIRNGRLYLSKIGEVRIFMHRPIEGKVRRLTIKHSAGQWYAIFIAEREKPKKMSVEDIPDARIRGIDLGLTKFAVLDNGDSEEYPKYLRKSEEKLKLLQRRLKHKKKGSKRWRQLCFRLSRLHDHIRNQRQDYQNKLIAQLYKENDALVLEKLNIKPMLKNHPLAKSISDASWGRFIAKAKHKADMLGKHFIAIDAAGTTQLCYNCLTWVPKTLSDREHRCPNCGAKLPRDLNSAKLIKRLGILNLRRPPPDGGSSPAEPEPLPSLQRMASKGVEAGSHPF